MVCDLFGVGVRVRMEVLWLWCAAYLRNPKPPNPPKLRNPKPENLNPLNPKAPKPSALNSTSKLLLAIEGPELQPKYYDQS